MTVVTTEPTVYATEAEARRAMLGLELARRRRIELSEEPGDVIDLAGPYRYKHGVYSSRATLDRRSSRRRSVGPRRGR